MSNADVSSSTKTLVRFQLPEPPERHPDEVTSIEYVHGPGNTLFLARHLGRSETTIVSAERYLVAARGSRPLRVPDLLIVFDVDPRALRRAERVCDLGSGQAAGFHPGGGVAEHGSGGYGRQARGLRGVGRAGVLALRPHGGIARDAAGGGSAGGQSL